MGGGRVVGVEEGKKARGAAEEEEEEEEEGKERFQSVRFVVDGTVK